MNSQLTALQRGEWELSDLIFFLNNSIIAGKEESSYLQSCVCSAGAQGEFLFPWSADGPQCLGYLAIKKLFFAVAFGDCFLKSSYFKLLV